MRNDPSLCRLIPETSLRNLYEFLRAFSKTEFHLQCAEEFRRKPSALDHIVRQSFEHFSVYDNQCEPFHNRHAHEGPTAARRTSNKLADKFAVALSDLKIVQLENDLSFEFVDYELSPWRTTGGTSFESGAPGKDSGRGGLDVLFANSLDRTPIVGEIKAREDATLLLALIQSLTYAVELSTPNQQRRLETFARGQIKFAETGPGVDIYMLLVQPSEKWTKQFLEYVDPLCRKLLNCEFVPTVVRRIVCMSTLFQDEKSVKLDLQFDYRGS